MNEPSLIQSNKNERDTSAISLLVSNIITLILALIQKWDISDVMWVYWGQSVIIGFFNWKRIRSLKQFSTDGLMMNNQPVVASKVAQRQIALFFALHYGVFHLAYLTFLIQFKSSLSSDAWIWISGCIVMFFFNHRFSYQYNLERDLRRVPNIGTIMMFPYARILPMHLTLIFGSMIGKGSWWELILFLSLKTIADLIMHTVEHRESKS